MERGSSSGGSPWKQQCLVCQKDILISYREHPELHTGCLTAWESFSESEKAAAKARSDSQKQEHAAHTLETEPISYSPSSSQYYSYSARTICDLCYKEIFVPFSEHPTLHTLCFSRWNRGERPSSAPKPREVGAKPYPAPPAATERSGGWKSNSGPKLGSPSPFQQFVIPKNPTQPAVESIADPVERILACSNYYQIFSVERSATEDELRSRFKKLALLVHPDRNKSPGATEAFKKVIQAWDCLGNEERRSKYDEKGFDESAADQQAQYIVVERWRLELLVELMNSLSSMVMGNLPFK